MKRNYEPSVNKKVLFISLIIGGGTWLLCQYLYSQLQMRLAGYFLIPILCALLFACIFISVGLGSLITRSFDRYSRLYFGFKSIVLYFFLGLVAVYLGAMLLEYLYELTPPLQYSEPSSYIFVDDESGSMSDNDPEGIRYDAISVIMNDEDNDLPYMVYAFSDNTRILREMGPMIENEAPIPNTCCGGTSIKGAIMRILQDYKDGKWDGGQSPKIIFLTDGYATDMGGFFGLSDMDREFNRVLADYAEKGITISTVGLGNVDQWLMRKMAETTGGVFISVEDASSLASAMKQATQGHSSRNLLSIRFMRKFSRLYGFFRIAFLSILGTLIGALMLFAYMDDSSIPLIMLFAAGSSLFGSTLFEIAVQFGVYPSAPWLFMWLLFAATPGYCYPQMILRKTSGRIIRSNYSYTTTLPFYWVQKNTEINKKL